MSDFKPMLAADCDGDVSKLRFPLLASAKIDGIRCVIVDGKALTRSLKPVPNKRIRDAFESKPFLEGIDGELVSRAEPANFQRTSSAVMGRESTDAVDLFVFDDWRQPEVRFEERLDGILRRYGMGTGAVDGSLAGPKLWVVHHRLVETEEQLLAFEAQCLAQGFEGVMLRDPAGKYKHGRSTLKEGGLVKLKRFADAEAVIVGFEERMRNGNEAYTDELGRTKRSSAQAGKVGRGDLGAFVLSMDGVKTTTVEFTCGSGLNDAQRVDFWARREELLGKLVKFKYLSHGMKDLPRHPTFIGLRDVRDV